MSLAISREKLSRIVSPEAPRYYSGNLICDGLNCAVKEEPRTFPRTGAVAASQHTWGIPQDAKTVSSTCRRSMILESGTSAPILRGWWSPVGTP